MVAAAVSGAEPVDARPREEGQDPGARAGGVGGGRALVRLYGGCARSRGTRPGELDRPGRPEVAREALVGAVVPASGRYTVQGRACRCALGRSSPSGDAALYSARTAATRPVRLWRQSRAGTVRRLSSGTTAERQTTFSVSPAWCRCPRRRAAT